MRLAAARNLGTHSTWIQARTVGMRAHVTSRLALGDSGLATDSFNIISGARLTGPSTSRAVQRDHRMVRGQPVLLVGLPYGVAGLYNVSTARPRRGQGIGTAMTVLPLLEAQMEGVLFGVLQTQGEARSLYARVGFVSAGVVAEYKPEVAQVLLTRVAALARVGANPGAVGFHYQRLLRSKGKG